MVRTPTELPAHANLTETAGGIVHSAEVADAAEGAAVVVSANGFGPSNPALLPEAIRSLIAGVEKAGMQLLDSPDFPPDWIGIAIAHRDALDLLKTSRLDWTSVCPAAIIHPGERTGKFRLGKD